jgi:LysR family hydrogen peroxide-inducible transcriptional activator
VELRRLEGAGGWRTLAMAWRPGSPRSAEYRAMAPLVVQACS